MWLSKKGINLERFSFGRHQMYGINENRNNSKYESVDKGVMVSFDNLDLEYNNILCDLRQNIPQSASRSALKILYQNVISPDCYLRLVVILKYFKAYIAVCIVLNKLCENQVEMCWRDYCAKYFVTRPWSEIFRTLSYLRLNPLRGLVLKCLISFRNIVPVWNRNVSKED